MSVNQIGTDFGSVDFRISLPKHIVWNKLFLKIVNWYAETNFLVHFYLNGYIHIDGGISKETFESQKITFFRKLFFMKPIIKLLDIFFKYEYK